MAITAENFKSLRSRCKAVRETDNQTWFSLWKDLADYILPRHGRWLDRSRTPGSVDKTAASKIINGTASRAVSIAKSGLKGGLVPHSLPWMKLSLYDESLNEWGRAKDWLHECERRMYNVFTKSNFYSAVDTTFIEQLVFGTGPFAVYEDAKTVIRCTPWTVGEYALLTDNTGRVDTAFRWYHMSARSMKEQFGEDNLSHSTKNLLTNKPDEMVLVYNAIFPRRDYVEGRVKKDELPWASVYWEDKASDNDKPLFESGFHQQPVMFPRWEVIGEDAYGSNCPGMEMLGDIKMLQKMESDKLTGISREANPPMNVPVGMKGGLNLRPNAINYVNPGDQDRITRTVDVKPQIQFIALEIERVENRIKQGFYNDLFLSMINDKNGMTAEEVIRRHEETITILGPFIERQNSEFLSPLVDRVWDIMSRSGMLPPAPRELSGQEIKVEYISLLAQAQKMVGTQPMEKVMALVGNMAQVSPEVLDKINTDTFVDVYAGLAGVNPKIIRTQDEVDIIRKQRVDAQQQQMAMEQAQQAANVAKNLNGVDLDKLQEMQGTAPLGGLPAA